MRLLLLGKESGVFFRFITFTICWSIFSVSPTQVRAAAGDVIGNTATIDFFILGVPSTQESSPTGNTSTGVGNGTPTIFTEDQVVNFSVSLTDAAPVNVVAGETNAYLTFSITNTGNETQDFLLAGLNTSPNPFGGVPDNFDPVPPIRVFVEDGTDISGFQSATDTEVFVDELAAGSTVTIYVVANMPAIVLGDLAVVALVAQVATGGAVGVGAAITNDDNNHVSPAGTYSNGAIAVVAGTPSNSPDTAGVDLVFGDPSGLAPEDIDSTGLPVTDVVSNGQHSDAGAYLGQTPPAAVNPIAKTVTVIDPRGGNNPETGATLRYQLVVSTTGLSTVDDLIVFDPIPANTTYVPNTITLNGAVQTDIIDNPIDFTNFDGAQIIVDISQGSTVSISTVTTNTIVFDVTID